MFDGFGVIHQQILLAEGPVTEQIQRVALHLLKHPMSDLHSINVVHWIANVVLEWLVLRREHLPSLIIAEDVAESDSLDSESSGFLDVIQCLAFVVRGEDAGELDGHLSVFGEGFEVGHLAGTVDLLEGCGIE